MTTRQPLDHGCHGRGPSLWTRPRRHGRIALFGHFGSSNFGNEATLEAVLHEIYRHDKRSEVTCICCNPSVVQSLRGLASVHASDVLFPRGPARSFVHKAAQGAFRGLANEIWRWFKALRVLRRVDLLLVPGTGLLTDFNGLRGWGPYSLFTWCLAAKLLGRQIAFLSVGAGPVTQPLGRWLVWAALSLADYRSYRDDSSKRCAAEIGVRSDADVISPDVVFGLPEERLVANVAPPGSPQAIAVGVMEHGGMYGLHGPDPVVYSRYLASLQQLIRWLLSLGHTVRLVVGDTEDAVVTERLWSGMRGSLSPTERDRLLWDMPPTVDAVFAQLMTADVVVATRFHTALFALLLRKPTMSVSFHHKCESLMHQIGVPEYCVRIEEANVDRLRDMYTRLVGDATNVQRHLRLTTAAFRHKLSEQYARVLTAL